MHSLYKLPRQSRKRAKVWRKLVKEQEESNQKVEPFCCEQEVNIKTFNAWRRKIKSENREGFIPVVIEHPKQCFYEITHKNGFSLKCGDQVNIQAIEQLLQAIGGVE